METTLKSGQYSSSQSLKKHFAMRIIGTCLFLGLLFAGCSTQDAAQTDLNGQITVTGSTALQPLMTAAAKLFQQDHPHVSVKVHGGGSFTGLDALLRQQADIATSDIYADRAIYPDPNLSDTIVGVVGFTMITHPDVDISSLTHQQILDIFSTGAIRNWKQVGGKDLAIVPVVHSRSSGTRAVFRKLVLGGRDESANSTGTFVQEDSNTSVLEAVAHTPGAIGYIALPEMNMSVHKLAIEGQDSSLANIESGQYSFWSYEHMYTLNNQNQLISTFLDFMSTSRVQQLAQKMNYISADTLHVKTTSPTKK